MLGSPASPRKRPFELLSDLVDDGGFGEDQHPERWDVSALDEMARYTKLGLGVGGELLACSEEGVLMGRWGRSQEEQDEEEERRRRNRYTAPSVTQEGQSSAGGKEDARFSVATATQRQLCIAGRVTGGAVDGGMSRERTMEVYQVAQEEDEVAATAAGLTLEHCSEEHNYSLIQGGELGTGSAHNSQSEEVQVAEEQELQGSEESQANTELEEEDEEQEEEEEEDGEEGAEETAVEAELSSSSETECGEFWLHYLYVCSSQVCKSLSAHTEISSVSSPEETSDHRVWLGLLRTGRLDIKCVGVFHSPHAGTTVPVSYGFEF